MASSRFAIASLGIIFMLTGLSPLVSLAQSRSTSETAVEVDFTETLALARTGNPEAMYAVALKLISETSDTKTSQTKASDAYQKDAFGWALSAARSGHPAAAELTGRLYRTGIGVDTNYVKARKWLLRGLNRGMNGAYFELALLFSDENNPAFNEDEAAKYMADALKRNEPRACLVSAEVKINSGHTTRKALKELTCAAKGGIVSAMLYIADYYETKRSPNAAYLARDWLKKAADAGNQDAARRLAE
jgi:TPR repeat protein